MRPASRRLTHLGFAASIALGAFIGAASQPARAQELPPSLAGELLYAEDETFSSEGTVEVSGDCRAVAGETLTLTYQAEGVAVGPYPGTFTESGTVTILLTDQRSPVQAIGAVVTWEAEFEIDSPLGHVTGTKTLTPSAFNDRVVSCLDGEASGVPGATWKIAVAGAPLDYQATIRPPTGGTFTDQGSSEGVIYRQECTSTPACSGGFPESEFFQEQFVASTGVLPLDSSGKATGGGQVMAGTNPLDAVTFGFNVRKSAAGERLHGMCNVVDHATGTRVKCRTVTDYQQIGNTATWTGTAEVDGAEEEYRITVQDNGEPNSGLDTFSIVTETYEAAGNVQHGNVQVHQQKIGL